MAVEEVVGKDSTAAFMAKMNNILRDFCGGGDARKNLKGC